MTSAGTHRFDLAPGFFPPPHAAPRLALAPSIGWEQPLLVRIHDGDCLALEELYEALGRPVYDSAHRITRESLAAELITAGVFIRLWRCPQEFPPGNLLRTLTRLADRRATRWIGE